VHKSGKKDGFMQSIVLTLRSLILSIDLLFVMKLGVHSYF